VFWGKGKKVMCGVCHKWVEKSKLKKLWHTDIVTDSDNSQRAEGPFQPILICNECMKMKVNT